MAESTISEDDRASTRFRILALTEIRAAMWSRIYSQGLATGHASLITLDPPSWSQFDALVIKRHRYIAAHPRDNRLLGWISALPAFPALSLGLDHRDSRRRTAGGVLELIVFVAQVERKTNVGTQLIRALQDSLRKDTRWSALQATVFPENQAAIALLNKNGFQEVSRRSNVGRMKDGPTKGQWRDVITLEKRLKEADEDQEQSNTEAETPSQDSPQQHDSSNQTQGADTLAEPPPSPSESLQPATIDPSAVLIFKRPRYE